MSGDATPLSMGMSGKNETLIRARMSRTEVCAIRKPMRIKSQRNVES